MKEDLYFIGFLVNVDDSILKLQLGNGFLIDKREQQEIMPFLQRLDFHYGAKSGFEIINFKQDGRPLGCYCINKHFPEFVGSTRDIQQSLRDKLRLLRLFKEGNIFMRYSLFYHLKESIPQVAQISREYPLTDQTLFQLIDDEYAQAESFINNTNIPFKQSFLRLAFDSFEQSYETYNRGLTFLSLMISIDALFGDFSELKYRVSRNTAVLLGNNIDESQKIFSDMNELYKKRSAVAHGGKDGKIVESKDVIKLRNYVRESIKLINKLHLNRKELLNVLNQSGFGQSPLLK